MKKAPAGIDSRVDRYNQGTALPATDAFADSITKNMGIIKGNVLKSNDFRKKCSTGKLNVNEEIKKLTVNFV